MGGFASRSPALVPTAGYGRGAGMSSAMGIAADPLMGRGYLIGKRETIAAGVTAYDIVNHGLADHYFRWKVRLSADATSGVAYIATRAYFLTVRVTGKSENDVITQTCQVPLNGGQTIYVPGRSLIVQVDNTTALGIDLNVGLDEGTPGLSPWTNVEVLSAVASATETALTVPTFAQTIQLLGLSGAGPWLLRGYDLSGNIVYEESLSLPRSAEIPVSPNMRYRVIQNTGGAQTAHVLYQCLG